ncbi:hypothetical protein VP01_2507g2 [Puccinia sorghi]|uniref:Uncharacterized protein n=1 Tax=Puccinia sorghi TaxID=27349 RepID=A0A0L6V5R3_9BASI|nr:hypothetical protein VP01_2507g2 [Puccinia sorghi]
MNQQDTTTTTVDEIYIPGLTSPNLFLELPSIAGFQRLLPQELAHQVFKEQLHQHSQSASSSSCSSLSQLTESCCWRALAIQARQQIVSSDPSHTATILKTWSYRLEALYQLRQPRIIVREMLGLFTTIGQTFPLTEILLNLGPDTLSPLSTAKTTPAGRPKKALPDIVPFDILLLRARLPVLLSPHHHSAVIKTADGLFELLEGCKRMAAYHDHNPEEVAQKELWKRRAIEIVGQLASLFCGHGFQPDGIVDSGAARQGLTEEEGERWVEMETKLWLELGALEQADQLLITLESTHPLAIVRAMVAGQLADASARFLPVATASLAQHEKPPDFSLVNNLAIALLYLGKLSQGFPIMQDMMAKLGPTLAACKPAENQRIIGASSSSSSEGQDKSRRFHAPVNGLILNYATWIELASGSDSERIKRDFLIQLLESASGLPQNQDQDQNQNSMDYPIHTIADLLSLNCFKFPASYPQSSS